MKKEGNQLKKDPLDIFINDGTDKFLNDGAGG